MRRPSPWAVLSAGALVLAIAGVISEFRNPVGGDPASLLYGAGRVLDGAKLYTDLVDLNPPFTFLFHTLPVLASRVLGLETILCFRVFVCALVTVSGLTLFATLRRAPIGAGTWHAFIAAFLLGSLGLVVGFFGEREHIQLVLVFPYLALASLRVLGLKPSRTLMVTCGVLAGIGLGLKVTAGMVPVLVAATLWLTARIRSDESLVALATLAAATGLGLVWAPGYLHTVEQFGGFYRGFALVPATRLLLSPAMVWPLLVAPLLLLVALPVMRFRAGALVWFAAVAGFALSVTVQGKGFPYHYYPARIGTLTVILLVLATTRDPRLATLWRDALRRALAGAALVLMTAIPAVVAWARLTAPERVVDDFSANAFRLLEAVPSGTTVAIHSSRLGDPFPLVLIRGLDMTGRFPHLWFLYPYDSSAVYHGRGVRPYADSVLTPVERALRHNVAEDLARDQPVLLLVRDPGTDRVVLRYLCDDSLYRRVAGAYRLAASDTVMQLFRRDTSMQGAGACASS
ncbi:MAG TPA: hypothetical protein VFL88_06310 [Gemmatimonadales bacterium]|nr:hypothetical protein [Gemmatimonadales bacterium]